MIDGIEIGDRIRTCQNEVFKAILRGETCILRLTDPGHRSLESIEEEVKLLRNLGSDTEIAAKPVTFPSGKFVESTKYEGKLYGAALFSFIEGTSADIASFALASNFGALLAKLHTALSELNGSYDLPEMHNSSGEKQLIHGDFNRTNVITRQGSFRIIDFENACYSTCEYELANSIYMTLFDARHKPVALLDSRFINGFLEGYTRDKCVDLEAVRSEIDRRVSILGGWIDDLSSAPLSISSASASWKIELNDFFHEYQGGAYEEILSDISSSNRALTDTRGVRTPVRTGAFGSKGYEFKT